MSGRGVIRASRGIDGGDELRLAPRRTLRGCRVASRSRRGSFTESFAGETCYRITSVWQPFINAVFSPSPLSFVSVFPLCVFFYIFLYLSIALSIASLNPSPILFVPTCIALFFFVSFHSFVCLWYEGK